MAGKFNLLSQTLILSISDASSAAKKLIDAVTPDSSRSIIEAAELLGLGITAELSQKADEMSLAEMEAEETPNDVAQGTI